MTLLSKIRGIFFAPNIAIDLGTANTRVFASGLGMVADTPTVVRLNRQESRAVLNSPPQCKSLAENGEFIMPLAGGVVTNIPAAAELLRELLQKTRRFDFAPQRVLICAPSDVSSRERLALVQAASRAGASSVAVVTEPLAAAIGAGLDVSTPYAQMLVDIGEGVTDIAVIREGALIQTASARTAGGNLRRAVQKLIKERNGVLLPENQAEMLVQKLATFNDYSLPDAMKACGTDEQGRAVSITVGSREVHEAISPIVNTIAEAIDRAIKELFLKEYVEVIESGLTLTGGVAQMPGLAEFVSAKTDLEVRTAPAPLYSVINGAGRILETACATRLWLS
jgi:rod shape-determining protein MreB